MTGPLVLTPGDPRGIGPEVVCVGLARRRAEGRPAQAVVVGDAEAVAREAARVGLGIRRVSAWPDDLSLGVPVLDPGDADEPVEVAALRLAVDACVHGRARALVTGPIHKGRLAARGFPFAGHTDFLGHLTGVHDPVMAFVGGRLRVALVTVHLPLREVAGALRSDAILHVIQTADAALRRHLGLPAPRLLVCGLNPHAGDGGVLGHEDLEIVAPAVEAAKARGIDAYGPISAERAFRDAAEGRGELVVAMYHDQGLVPLKLVDFGASVNWTLGLPFVRTSVDHGTADDIAGKGIADPGSLLAALALAESVSASGSPDRSSR